MLTLYRIGLRLLRLAGPLLSRGGSKFARGVAGRRRAHEELASWGRTVRNQARPVVWFHAPSVGEALQAKACIDAWKTVRPEVQVVFTYFSPSAEDMAGTVGADVVAYLPWDLSGPVEEVLDAIRPDALVFTKTEVWPVLCTEARARGVPVALVAGSVPDGAGRLRWPARALLSPTWAALSLVAANSESDGERFAELGVPRDRVIVTGDPGVDSAASRVSLRSKESGWRTACEGLQRPVLVAGSTWPADEAVIIPALSLLRERVDVFTVLVAPHEPGPDAVDGLDRRLRENGWRVATLSALESESGASPPDIVLVDRVGILAELYTMAAASFVGGGFHDHGLHSVIEPAAAQSPVVFGPRHHAARAAADLLEAGGAKIAASPEELADVVGAWLSNSEVRERIGRRARGYIDAHLGAAERTGEWLDALLDPVSSP